MTSKTSTSPALAALAALSPAEVSALVIVARERSAAIDAYKARQAHERQWDEHYRQRAHAEAQEAQEKATRIEAAEAAAKKLATRPVRPGDDVLALVRELIATARVLRPTHPGHIATATRAQRLAIVAVAAGASDLAAMEALAVRDARQWQQVRYANLSALSAPEFEAFLAAAKAATDA